ncbi:MAG: hypothetical protein ACXABH_10535, partial [Candidatus Thorarchaeota archaeon]
DHVARYTSQCNEMTMRLADTGTLANLFDFEPTLQFDGPAGIDFTVTIQAWQKTADTAIGVADGTTGMDVTLTVPSGAEYGAHEGMLYLEDTSSGFTHEVPYSYTVEMDLDGAMGATHTLVDGPGAETTPFDTGAVTTSFTYGTDRTDEGGGLTTFHFNVPYNIAYNASYLVMRAMWQNYGTVVDMNLRSETGSELMATDDGGRPFDPAPTGDKTNTIIYDPGGLINGTYWFYYSVHVINGSAVPEPITIELQLYGENDLGAATNVFNWTARDMTTPTTISASDVLTGDHVTIENTWTIPAVAGLPEYSTITNTQIALLSGLYEVIPGTYADPGGRDAWPIPLTDTAFYVWETVEGISAGATVQVDLDAQGGSDPSFDVYDWADADSDGEVDLDEIGATALLSVDNGGGGAAEGGSYVAAVSGDIAIRVFCWAWAYGHQDYVLEVDTRASVDVDSLTAIASLDTYSFLRNITMDIYLYCWTETDVVWTVDFGTLSFENFFPPVVTINAPVDLTGDVYNFTWTATDQNADDSIYFQVWLSSDSGATYQLLAQNVTETFYVWDSSSFLERSTYMYRIRAYSVDLVYTAGGASVADPPASYWPGNFADFFSGVFDGGAVVIIPTTTTTPPPTTTTPTTPPPTPPPIDPLLIGLLGGLGVGVVVLLILFLIRKR